MVRHSVFGDPGSPTYVPAGALWDLIHSEILNQCDAIDGAVDGIVEDPILCRFRPEALLCPPGTGVNLTTCLTSAQVLAVREAFTDYYGVDGQLIFPRMQPGSEEIAQYVYYTTGAFSYSVDWFRYVVFSKLFKVIERFTSDNCPDNPSWNASTYSRLDAKIAGDQNPFNVQTWNGDLSAFKNKGGKVCKFAFAPLPNMYFSINGLV
jgi:feruloyl esterase